MNAGILALALLLGSSAYAQTPTGTNTFYDHSDTGQTVHVLPTPASVQPPRDTQPTDAPAHRGTSVYPASYGSGNLTDHGGLEIANAGFQEVYWNSSVATAVQPTISSFVSSFGSGVADYTVIQQYSSAATINATLWQNQAHNGQPLVDSQSAASKYSDSQIQTYLTNAFNSGKLIAQSNTIYGIYFPSGMRICLQGGCSCSSFCGYHSHFTYGSTQIKYAVFPYPSCLGCSLSGKSATDMLTIVSSHEIREAVTDPGDSGVNAWYDSSGYEADDKCAWHNLYKMSTSGYWVQPEYSNAQTGCVVP